MIRLSVEAKLSLVGQATRVVLHRGAEVVARSRPARVGEVPIRVENLTAEWLSAALCSRVPGAAVTGFELGAGSSGTSDRRGLTVEYNNVGTAAGCRVSCSPRPPRTSRPGCSPA